MFAQFNQYSKKILRQLRNIAAKGLTILANGAQGVIILPLTAVVAFPQRIYYSCKRREILSDRFLSSVDDAVSRELRDIILGGDEIPLNQNSTKFLIQSRMRLPSEIFIFQDIYLIFSVFIFITACFNDPIKRNLVNQFIFHEFSPIRALTFTLSGISFIAAASKPKILWINLEFLKSKFNNLLNYKNSNETDKIMKKLDIETGEYAACNFIRNSAANLEQAIELIPYCPKIKFKSDFLVENYQVKYLMLSRTLLKDILPEPLIETIQDYCELPAVCISYKNSIKFSSDTTIQIHSDVQEVFENVVKTRKKGNVHHI